MTTKEKIMRAIGEIPEKYYPELLDLIVAFKEKDKAIQGTGNWDRFFGLLTHNQAETMRRVIEDEFEIIEDVAD